MSLPASVRSLRVRDLRRADLPDIIRIDAAHAGLPRAAYWSAVLRDFLDGKDGRLRVGLGAERGDRLVGHLLGEVRAFEFGSEPCGWIFAVGVDRASLRHGVASRLLDEACARFRKAGLARVRTMVKRTDVPVHAFFRAAGFVAGSFVQLEMSLEEEA